MSETEQDNTPVLDVKLDIILQNKDKFWLSKFDISDNDMIQRNMMFLKMITKPQTMNE